MLRLKNIVKTYKVADNEVQALKGINLSFRKNEFVSILGASGCGKTTTLNIIGGLDKYTSGDLFINGVSTKEFKDRDWDVYRNHRIGFIFQAYNLIPHQTILQNVELALTISGISKEERTRRAKEALDEVGLIGQYKKKPNQLSGGQCQRVAIARALVNNPEILLADEPTGALDSETSVQIMELIKRIAEDRLVIMVTHNPELAEKYSTRIVRLKDGEVIEDTNPFSEEDEIEEVKRLNEEKNVEVEIIDKPKKEKAKMSFHQAFLLSLKNLLSKSKRTIMIIIAGSIGIIGVALVLAVSRGVNDYIDNMQDDMLSGNPVYIGETAIDYEQIMSNSTLDVKKSALEKGDYVNVNLMIQYLVANQDVLLNMISKNAINKDYIDYAMSMPQEYYNAIQFDYGLDITTNLYTKFDIGYAQDTHDGVDKEDVRSVKSITDTYTSLIKEMDDYKDYASVITSIAKTFSQAVSNNDYISGQYDVVYGSLPKNYNDVIIVLDQDSMLSDLLLAQLGYFTEEEFFNMVYDGLFDALSGKETNYDALAMAYKNAKTSAGYPLKFEYADLVGKKFTWYSNDAVYTKNLMPTSISNYYNYNYKYNESFDSVDHIDLNICGIVKPKSGISYGALSTGFLYTEALAKEIIKINYNTQIAKEVRNGIKLPSMDTAIHQLYGIEYNLPYYYKNPAQYEGSGKTVVNTNNKVYVGNQTQLSSFISTFMGMGSTTNGLEYTSYTIDDRYLGANTLPKTINFYPLNFDKKDLITDYLDKWNSDSDITFNVYESILNQNNSLDAKVLTTKTLTKADRSDGYYIDANYNIIHKADVTSNTNLDGYTFVSATGKIKYTDTVGVVIKMINQMIQLVTIALVAFTALSLVVSTVMVGIITYVSVVERIKEIGVIRSLGGRKKDVSNLFTAETLMIGFSSGVFGIVVTGILCLIINGVVKGVSDGTLTSICHLTLPTAIIMVVLSMLLTFIAGILPAKNAARRDPVQALRSE